MAKVKMGNWEFDEQELDRQYIAAVKRGEQRIKAKPRAAAAYYDSEHKRIVVELTNGCVFMFPPELAQGLRGASAEALAEVRIMPAGLALGWDKLDAHFRIAGLMAGEFGNSEWMAEMRKRQRDVVSANKTPARTNSKKHAPPRKTG